jgi:hypothetical protein
MRKNWISDGLIPAKGQAANANWLITLPLPQHRDIPRSDCVQNGGGMWPQCGARSPRGRKRMRNVRRRVAGRGATASCSQLQKTANFSTALHLGGVDNSGFRRLYTASRRAAALAGWRVCEAPHCLHGDQASGHDHMAMSDVRASAAPALFRRRGREVPGCLTSESEERETWTAESLRTASANGEGFDRSRTGTDAVGRDFGGQRFRSTPGHASDR